MPVTGRPLTDGPKHNRVAATHDWIDVDDVPYAGPVPVELPTSRDIVLKDEVRSVSLDPMTIDWWASVCRLPHAVLWAETDWQFALATAMVADMAFRGSAPAMGELRQREKIIGTTLDSRRGLRLRYVPVAKAEKATTSRRRGKGAASSSTVTSIESRRARLAGAS